ncbi:ATP-binding cassette domain-containing protein, partial [Tessaracoccus lubricantis]
MHNPSITFADASFAWPDGSAVLDHVSTAFSPGRTGLVGDNGAGKTTVLRLIRGELAPTAGQITTRGAVGYLPQHLTLAVESDVATLLGVRPKLAALQAIEAGSVDEHAFDTLGDDWDVEARSLAELAAMGLAGIGLDRRVGTLSGGEAMLVALTGLRLAETPVVLLDEPTNNLDGAARERLYAAIAGWRGALVVASHDVGLLDLLDDTAELRAGDVTVFGGGYTEFAEALEREQDAAQQALRTAEQRLKLEQRQRREAETKLARRKRYADKDYANKRRPKIIMNLRRGEAEVSAGKLRDGLDDRVESARGAVVEQEARVRVDERVRIALPDPGVG